MIRGMQANMFSIVLKDETGESTFDLVGKRIVPKEMPAKKDLTVWKAFIDSVQTEVGFYRDLSQEESPEIKSLFPQVFYCGGTDIRSGER